MRLILQIVEGPAVGRRFLLAAGQTARVGRTEWADFAVPADGQLADVHFAVEANLDGCSVQRLGDAPLQVNGQGAAESSLRDGDRLTAGGSVFHVQIEGAALRSAAGAEAAERSESAANQPAGGDSTAADVAARIELSEAANPLLSAEQTVDQFIELLLNAGLTPDAVRMRAAELSNRDAVRWAVRCVREMAGQSPRPADAAALDAAEKWADDPTEENRRAAESAAAALNHQGAAAFAALGAFWSGGSLAPSGLPPAPVPEGLYIQGVAGAVLLASASARPEEVHKTLCKFLTTS
ncbi:MAG: FHA domain-containing protein [Planctomycetes bacterium]|nr:FHA domain-containing protein [Planctomycetota bacterium]